MNNNNACTLTDYKLALATISQIIEENRGNVPIVQASKTVSQVLKETSHNFLQVKDENIELSAKYCLNRTKIVIENLNKIYSHTKGEETNLHESLLIIMEIVEDKVKRLGENIR